MTDNRGFHFLVLLVSFIGIGAMAADKISPDLALENIYQFRPGKAVSGDVLRQLETPQRELFSDGEVILTEPGSIRIWEYHTKVKIHYASGEVEESLPKTSFSFDAKTDKLLGVNWNVGDEDRELNLDFVKSKFKMAHFIKREAEQICSHFSPDEVYFEDKKLGLSITWRKTRKEVESISWGIQDNSRAVAEKQKSHPKINCSIGG